MSGAKAEIAIGGGPFSHPVRLDRLARRDAHGFELVPDAEARARIAAHLGARSVGKMRFEGEIEPAGAEGWRLCGSLGASVVQSCVVTLEPVKTRVDVEVARLYQPMAAGAEVEVDPGEDEDVEDLPRTLDLGAVAVEELSLALPDYPRAEGAELEGAEDDGDDDRPAPFAALAALRDKLEEGGD